MATRRVKSVDGRMLPILERKGAFVGYVEVAADGDYSVPGGRQYKRLSQAVEVPDNGYYRRAIARGDIAEDVPAAAPAKAAKAESKEG